MGDSYSAGEGADPDDAPCHQSPRAYGPYYARELSPVDLNLVFLACTGASLDDLGADQLPYVPVDAALITLTICQGPAGSARRRS